jgi:dipeptidyl-peptidase-4
MKSLDFYHPEKETRCMLTRTRLTLLLAALLLSLPLAAETLGKTPLTLEAIFTGDLIGPQPEQLRWSPDGRLLSYILAGEGGRRDLWAVEAASGEKRVLVSHEQLVRLAPSAAEATTDERERERLLRYAVAAYVWAPDSKSILFVSSGQLYLFELAAGQARLLAPSKQNVRDPKFSPDGQWVAFVYNYDLWAVPTAGGEEKRLTLGGSADLLHGDLDWVYPEEFGIRSGYEWSPDSRRIAFLELDQRSVPTYPIVDWVPVEAPVDFQRYPKAGDPNPRPRIGIVDVAAALARPGGAAGTEVAWLDRTAEYIPRFSWATAEQLAVQLLNRAQNESQVVLAEAATGRSRVITGDRARYWINITDDLHFLGGGRYLWTNEHKGFRHIALHWTDSPMRRTLTSGEWEVGEIKGVDPAGGWVYFTANEDNPLGNGLYRMKTSGGKRERLTQERGTHTIVMNPLTTAYADTYSALGAPPQLIVYDLASGKRTVAHPARALDTYQTVQPELVEMKAPDGTLVRGMLLKPEPLEPGRRYPVVMHVYGGPRSPTIRDAWGGNRYLFHQYLAQQGFVVLYVDDRASSLLGYVHETALHKNYGPTALGDHRVAVEWLKQQPFVDPGRIAIWGASGGGFATCFALTHSDLFKVGIAVAPVTDWRLYDSIYTERYMGLPQEEPEAYQKTSCVEAAANLSGRLLLVHGDADDNVHMQNTVQLIHALTEAGKPYDLWVYPRKTHSFRGGATQLHLYRGMAEYLKDHL